MYVSTSILKYTPQLVLAKLPKTIAEPFVFECEISNYIHV